MTVTEFPPIDAHTVRALRESLRELVSRLEPDDVCVFDAPGLWSELCAIETLAAAAMTLLARKVEAACTWRSAGFRSAAEQLASVAGISIASAKRILETSKQLETLPATVQVLRSGKLSSGKVEAIASACSAAPDAEPDLLKLAVQAPLGKVREECLRVKAAVDPEGRHDRIRRERAVREFTDTEGAWNFHARGTVEDGARFRAEHRPVVDEMFEKARAEGHKEPYEAYAFDAFLELARRGGGNADESGTDANARRRSASTFGALIRVDIEALQRGAVEGDEVCEIPGLGPIPVRVARELLGDAVLKVVITKGVDVMNVTHLGRSATIAQKVALWWQSPCCQAEDCTRTWRLQDDHRIGWVKTRNTRLDDLDRLCEHHHHLKTFDNWALVKGEGKRPMVPPDDPRHPDYRAPPDP